MSEFTAKEISRKCDRLVRWYDLLEGVPDFGIRKLGRRLLQQAF
jgi:hypothetical protein